LGKPQNLLKKLDFPVWENAGFSFCRRVLNVMYRMEGKSEKERFIYGTWEGSTTISIPAQAELGSPASSIACNLVMTITPETFTEVMNLPAPALNEICGSSLAQGSPALGFLGIL
jgi:hypothetical protein